MKTKTIATLMIPHYKDIWKNDESRVVGDKERETDSNTQQDQKYKGTADRHAAKTEMQMWTEMETGTWRWKSEHGNRSGYGCRQRCRDRHTYTYVVHSIRLPQWITKAARRSLLQRTPDKGLQCGATPG